MTLRQMQLLDEIQNTMFFIQLHPNLTDTIFQKRKIIPSLVFLPDENGLIIRMEIQMVILSEVKIILVFSRPAMSFWFTRVTSPI